MTQSLSKLSEGESCCSTSATAAEYLLGKLIIVSISRIVTVADVGSKGQRPFDGGAEQSVPEASSDLI